MQPNGYTLWSRQTITSQIFASKPDKWFKIWFYIVNRVNFKDSEKWLRGECFIQSGEIERQTGATTDQVKKCLKWLRQVDSVSTARSTRGIHIKVLKYNVYQDSEKYKSTRKALEKHQRSTTIVEEGKKVNILGEINSPKENPLKDNNNTMGNWDKTSDNDDGLPEYDSDSREEVKPKRVKAPSTKKATPEVEAVFKLFGKDCLKRIGVHKQEMEAAVFLSEEHSIETLQSAVTYMQENSGHQFLPVILSPFDLRMKWARLKDFKEKHG